MGLIKVRLRRSKDQTPEGTQQPAAPESIKRYRVQSMTAQATQLQYSRSVRSHKDDFRLVTQTWKREDPGPIQILEPSEASFRSGHSTWSGNTCDTMIEVKTSPQKDVSVGNVSPTFSLCGSEMSSPSLSYTDSISSSSSSWSYKSDSSVRTKKSYTTISAGIPPLLPAHRTFSGNPHHGSFCKPRKSSENLKGHHRTASDYIPVHVFTRQCSQLITSGDPIKAPRQNLQTDAGYHGNKFNLDGYAGGLRVVNTTPPGSPLPNNHEPKQIHSFQQHWSPERVPERAPERYRVPSKAALMDY